MTDINVRQVAFSYTSSGGAGQKTTATVGVRTSDGVVYGYGQAENQDDEQALLLAYQNALAQAKSAPEIAMTTSEQDVASVTVES